MRLGVPRRRISRQLNAPVIIDLVKLKIVQHVQHNVMYYVFAMLQHSVSLELLIHKFILALFPFNQNTQFIFLYCRLMAALQ